MRNNKILIILFLIILLIFLLIARESMTSIALAKQFAVNQDITKLAKTSTWKDIGVPTSPKNGVPLVIITIDEDEKTIEEANREDDENIYGNIKEINESLDHFVKGKGNVEIILPDNYVSDYGSSNIPDGPQELEYFRGRGNATWKYQKRAYKIKYKDAHNILGMGKNKEWGLLANYHDYTLSQNAIAMWVANKLDMKYSIQLVPVEVVLKGTKTESVYLGSYYLTELVDLGEGRIELPELKNDEKEDITGGYLISLYFEDQDNDKPKSQRFKAKYSGLEFLNRNPKFDNEDLPEGREIQKSYIRDYVDKIDDIIMNNEVIEREKHNQLSELMDLESTADFYLMQEFFINVDAYKTSSNYLYKKPNGKLYWGPLWDFDWTFYQADAEIPSSYITFDCHTANPWIDNLRFKDKEFVELLKERWKKLDSILQKVIEEGGIIDQYKEKRTSLLG